MQSSTSPKKPSPLSFGSPRTSPFKRSESPIARTPSTVRSATPTQDTFSPGQPSSQAAVRSFSPGGAAQNKTASPASLRNSGKTGDPLSKLAPAQIHELRESFQVLDRDNDGQVNKDDVQEALTQLGQDASVAALAPFFPPPSSASLNLPNYLHTLSSLLAPMSEPSELTAAFGAFDVHDSGQIDVEELRDALLRTPPEDGERKLTDREIDSVLNEFTSRRAFGKSGFGRDAMLGKNGDVFRYMDFVSSLTPGGGGKADAPVGQVHP